METENILKKIDNDEVQKLPLLKFKGEIITIDNIKQYNEVIPVIAIETILGFDTETRPSFKKGQSNKVSLLQLGTLDKVYLFRLNKIGLPDGLIKLLSDVNRKKIGVAIKDDIIHLQKLKQFTPAGFVDLQKLVGTNGIGELGLRKIAAIVLKGRISKNEQLSNWENDTLTGKQKIYAATDAWACVKIYEKLLKKQP
ncbi:MAG: 3'-5' exonuclease domain-containing protein 2 [Chlorobi bacterium]|nr:3'-5' exonuclease domain-containing protein 2 [Chlorobiota bacterium]